jgi:hypothetical protein
LRLSQARLYVHLTMSQSDNGQALLRQDQRPLSICGSNSEAAQGFTAERVLRTRPKTYRTIVKLLADPDAKVLQIAKLHRVSEHTVHAIREREAVAIAERKQRLMSIFANVAEMSAERMEELAGEANLRDAGITAGIATDKLLALSGDPTSSFQQTHIHLQSFDIAGTFNSLLHSLQAKARALHPSPPPALTDQRPDAEQRESLRE